ncbi:type VII secretion protein EccCa [Corynebacterium sp. MSK044]|uniref:type VII secretion protein EccCa n=1 Tax=Corynebacterium sp. MSK044 TaxID=3050195 RepID=UPI002550A1D0|nr:type VII secretion protein EccCa [Corynebacterium sp. MSK044]MDK8797720.1 type VII secretion protein EccCa [Corynebacterium sp. MSK044]
MSTRIVHRPARLHRTIPKEKPLRLAQVPTIRSRSGGAGVMMLLMPIIAGTGMVMMMFSSGNPIRMVVGCFMFVAVILGAVLMFIRQRTGSRRQAEEERERFLEHLEEVEGEIRELAREQQVEALTRHPHPRSLVDVVRDPYRLWERRPGDEDFLVTRIGTGIGTFARGVDVPPVTNPMQVAEPISQAHLDRMKRRTCSIDGLPIAIPARGSVSLVGPPELTTETVRAILSQTAIFHAPDDVRFHLVLPFADETDRSSWPLWFPHLLSPEEFDGPIGKRSVSFDAETSERLLRELSERDEEVKERSRYHKTLIDRTHLLIVLDMDSEHGKQLSGRIDSMRSLESSRVTVLATSRVQHSEPSKVDVRVLLRPDRSFTVQLLDRGEVREPKEGEAGYAERVLYGGDSGLLDEVSPAIAESIARSISPLRLVEDASPDSTLERTIALDDMLGIANFATYDVVEAWQPRSTRDFLNVPFGVGADGEPVNLDIKESAKSGMGPHGLCVGATGSGKSEVLRTLVLSQVICHPPDQLSLVLVDFKGGATFAGLEPLPHTSAIVDNLEDGAGLVDRLHDSILGEIQRRQRVLQEAGNLANVAEYNQLRSEGKVTEPLPVLFVVIDEFGELLAAKPEFIELFVQIGRIGRSIGVHLLLASQRLEEGRLRGLESYLSYRIGLRTFSAQESRAAIGTTDAHELPPIPGSGFLKVDPDIFDRFKAAYVSGPYEAIERAHERELPPVPMPLDLINTTEEWLRQREKEHSQFLEQRNARLTDGTPPETTLDLVVGRLAPAAEKTRQIWLPPLPESLSLQGAVGPVEMSSERGLSAASPGHMVFTLGLRDKPLDQWQGPLTLDLSGAGGNVAIMGAPQSGKSTALRTLVTAAALTHTPREVNFYLIDMSGSGLSYLEDLPHVGTVATRFDEDKLRRTVAEIGMFLVEREQLFSAHHISNVEEMREMHKKRLLSDLPAADIVLAIDGWSTLRKDYDDVAEQVTEIAQRGLAYGIHVVFATGRWADFRLPLQAVIGTRLEFALNDPIDSAMGKKISEGLVGLPTGRAAIADGTYSHIALPILEQRGLGVPMTPQETVAAIAEGWRGAGAPPVRMLPSAVALAEIRRSFPDTPPVRLGLTETTLGPARFDTEGDERHIFVIGDSASGKTTTLRTYIEEVTAGKQPGAIMFGVWDLRRGLLGAVPDQFLGGFAGTREGCETLAKGIASELGRRLPGRDITAEQLRSRSWWSGPEIYVLVDNYDGLEGSNNPLKPLAPFISQAADVGLHIIIARRSSGMSRASYDPLMQAIREAGAAGVLLSGERQEGAIFPGVFLKRLPAGRAQWVNRSGRVEMIQIARDEPTDLDI